VTDYEIEEVFRQMEEGSRAGIRNTEDVIVSELIREREGERESLSNQISELASQIEELEGGLRTLHGEVEEEIPSLISVSKNIEETAALCS